MTEQFGRNHADERQGIKGFHLLQKLPDKALRWASFDDNSVSNIEEPIKKLREKYSIETDQRKTWDTWYKEFAPKTQDVNEYVKFYKTDKKHSILIFKSHYLNYCYLRKVLLTVYLNGLGLSQIS
jgi:hypothetical protein